MDEMEEADCAKIVKKDQCKKKGDKCKKSCDMCDDEPATTASGEGTTMEGGILSYTNITLLENTLT